MKKIPVKSIKLFNTEKSTYYSLTNCPIKKNHQYLASLNTKQKNGLFLKKNPF